MEQLEDGPGGKSIFTTSPPRRVALNTNWYQIGNGPDLSLVADADCTVIGGSDSTAGAVLPRPGTHGANLRFIPSGGHPPTPVNGDIWMTNAGMYVHIGGVTRQVTLGTA